MVACVSGFFGERVAEALQRLGAKVIRVEAEWGEAVNVDDVKKALETSNASIVTVVHGETSTGVLNPLPELAKVVKEHDKLLFVDAVSAMGGADIKFDKWGIDVVFGSSQKAFGVPPGLAVAAIS